MPLDNALAVLWLVGAATFWCCGPIAGIYVIRIQLATTPEKQQQLTRRWKLFGLTAGVGWLTGSSAAVVRWLTN